MKASITSVIETPSPVMAGLVPAIHVVFYQSTKDVDARDKPGHDTSLKEAAAC
jgi:hypothetical protein